MRHALCVVYNNMGIDYAEKKVFDRAVTYFGAALKLSPNDAETKRNLERVEAAVKGEAEKRAREETEHKRAESRKMLLSIWNRKTIIIMVGGTGLYVLLSFLVRRFRFSEPFCSGMGLFLSM
ncbi:MAG: TPR repeat-containing protein [Treponematales bacterium]